MHYIRSRGVAINTTISRDFVTSLALAITITLVAIGGVTSADVVGYWRAETDDNPGAGLSVPNEIAAGSPLVCASANISANVPLDTVALTGQPNLGSIDGDANINGSIAQYAALDVDSITVEFFARTPEGGGDLISRTDGSSAGFLMTNYYSVDVNYFVEDGAGSSQAVTINSTYDMDSDWDHMAWTYDMASGVGRLLVNGVEKATSSITTPGRALVWSADDIVVGNEMDASHALDGFFDEIRISDRALLARETLLSDGVTAGHWRMEADLNSSSTGLEVANEVVFGNSLKSPTAIITPDVPIGALMVTGTSNSGSVDGRANINGTVAAYEALNTESITVEFWARSNEGGGTFVSRTSGDNGFVIETPYSMDFSYWVDDGAGGTEVTIDDVYNLNGMDWTHFAWTYDAATGLGLVYIDGELVDSHDGPDGQPLLWDIAAALSVGSGIDGGGPFSADDQGIFDELRISRVALDPSQFLNYVPEPGSAVLALLAALGLSLFTRRRSR